MSQQNEILMEDDSQIEEYLRESSPPPNTSNMNENEAPNDNVNDSTNDDSEIVLNLEASTSTEGQVSMFLITCNIRKVSMNV